MFVFERERGPGPRSRQRSGTLIGLVLALVLACACALCGLALGSGANATAPGPTPGPAYLAYATGSELPQVWAAGPSGVSPKRLGEGGEPLLAPDGSLVAASRSASSGASLLVYSVAGAPVRSYGNLAAGTARALAWSPDSKYLAVAMQSTATSGIAGGSSLVVIEVATGTMKTIARGIVEGASFAPDGSDEIAYGLTQSLGERAKVNVYLSAVDGSGVHALTSDGRSLYPVWGSTGIAYDRERLRRREFPVYQIWLASPNGGRPRQVTRVKVGRLVSGLVPFAFSADGSRLLAEFVGQDTSQAWTVVMRTGHARMLTAGRHMLQGAGISADGTTVLVDVDSLFTAPSSARIATMPFGGGPLHVLVAHGAQASWNE